MNGFDIRQHVVDHAEREREYQLARHEFEVEPIDSERRALLFDRMARLQTDLGELEAELPDAEK
jgi:hypothetical protein